jgi:hypothetical protein
MTAAVPGYARSRCRHARSLILFYMNAPDAPGFSCAQIDRIGCSFIFGLFAASFAAGPDEIR